MRLIDADALKERLIQNITLTNAIDRSFSEVPSIDIVRCKECKWSKANGTYQWCGRLDSTAQITADDFCSYGERKSDEQ